MSPQDSTHGNSRLDMSLPGYWQHADPVSGKKYKCGYCDSIVAPHSGWWCQQGGALPTTGSIYICSNCNRPTFVEQPGGEQFPGIILGNPVNGLPDGIARLYRECRTSTSVRAYTPAVLGLRKLLMNIAVDKEANEGQTFQQYVDYLATKYVSPASKDWVDRIRKKGNDATHKIPPMEESDAEDLLNFTEMLLKIIYEFPSRLPKIEA